MELYDNQGSSTPLTAKEEKAQPVRAKQKKEDRLSLLKSGLFFFGLSAARQMGFFLFEAPHSGGTPSETRQSHHILIQSLIIEIIIFLTQVKHNQVDIV